MTVTIHTTAHSLTHFLPRYDSILESTQSVCALTQILVNSRVCLSSIPSPTLTIPTVPPSIVQYTPLLSDIPDSHPITYNSGSCRQSIVHPRPPAPPLLTSHLHQSYGYFSQDGAHSLLREGRKGSRPCPETYHPSREESQVGVIYHQDIQTQLPRSPTESAPPRPGR